MRLPRLRLMLASTAVALATVCGAPSGASADTWPVPSAGDLSRDVDTLTDDELEAALMVGINDARAKHGLRAIRVFDACTDRLAEAWGERIARTGRFVHRDQGEVIRKCDNAWAGETLVRGTGLTPDVMVRLWLDSPSHRDILLSPRARRAGVAITQDAQGRTIGVVNLVRQG
ncbi:CAP domain-containing protein [Nocardioides sp. SYSU D00065]|uniref:CAP domain-containing protein n=1 Tax=Nocardioides sp. SYSU D00065 TaxID=2817378 RepID=UPI001B309CFE|nr:CAP domain-containing protein [Nocardioides sp. SYSU D00065]